MIDTFFSSDGTTWNKLYTLGVYTKRVQIGDAERKKSSVDIPFADGEVETYSAITPYPVYKRRKLTITLKFNPTTARTDYHSISKKYHGKSLYVGFGDSANDAPDYPIYSGYVKVGTGQSKEQGWESKIEVDAEPYARYQSTSTSVAVGESTLTYSDVFYGDLLTFKTETDGTVTFSQTRNGKTYTTSIASAGTYVLPNIFLVDGDNEINVDAEVAATVIYTRRTI